MRRITLIIKIEEIRACQNQTINFDFTDNKMEGIRLASPVKIKGFAEVQNEGFLVCGEYAAEIMTTCVRCLEDIKVNLAGNFQEYFLDSESFKRYLDSLESECEIDDSGVVEAIDNEIDITELVREHIILEMTPYPACEPECEGIEELEKYADDGVDLRWQKLFELKN